MIVVRLMGGLGNQMFQYAFGKYLALKNNTQLKIDVSLLKDRSIPNEIATHREYSLDIFNLENFSFASEKEIWRFNGYSSPDLIQRIIRRIYLFFNTPNLVIQNKNNYSDAYSEVPDNSCIVGRWQSEKLFSPAEKQLRKEFSFKEKFNSEITFLAEEIKNSNSVCIHFRRKDLLTSSVYKKTHGVLEMSYYNQAISIIKEKIANPSLYIFSDDIDWCLNNFKSDFPFKIIDNEFSGNKSAGHLFLMSCCKHFIISNSTFAWWGAWLSLSKEKIVIAPEKWYLDSSLKNDLLLPNSWIVL